MSLPPLRCHPELVAERRGHRARCPRCGSFWDVAYAAEPFRYADDYPAERRHHDPRVGRRKAETLREWLRELRLDPRDHVVAEVGFGGGFGLADLGRSARAVFGVEAVAANLAHARTLGLPADALFLDEERPARLGHPVSLWLFLDAFEHLPDPDGMLEWVVANSATGARALVVAPEAGSRSERWLGRLWPHRLADHPFHWSACGLLACFGRHGFVLERRFNPRKRLGTEVLVDHLGRSWLPALRRLGAWVPRLTFRGNLGEVGLLFHLRRAVG